MLHVILNEWLFPFIAVSFFFVFISTNVVFGFWFLHGWCHMKLLLCSVAVHLYSLSVFAVDIHWHQCGTGLMIKSILVSSLEAVIVLLHVPAHSVVLIVNNKKETIKKKETSIIVY